MKKVEATYELKRSPLNKLGNHRKLAALLRVDVSELRRLSGAGQAAYSSWTATNEKGKSRLIENPRPRLKRLQARIAKLLTEVTPPQFLHCPVKGRSYIGNAQVHVGARQIVTMDVANYFPSTTWERVYWFFNKRLGMPSDTAWTLASVACLDQRLPTGSPLSPIMSYYAHEDMWLRVEQIVIAAGCKLTVYMDDITISGDVVAESLVFRVKQAVTGVGLRLSEKKQRRFSKGEAVITGVVTTRAGVRPRKGSHLKLRNLRAARNTSDAELEYGKFDRRVRGLVSQHTQIQRMNAT